MGILTAGKITYGRTVQPAQYESKKAEVEICFVAADDGSDFDALLKQAGEIAMSKAHEMVGLKAAPKAAAASEAKPERTKADLEREAVAAAANPPKAAEPAAATVRGKRPPAQKKAEEAPQIRTNPENRGDGLFGEEDDFSGDVSPEVPVAEITDADLQAACQKKNAAIKNPVAIRGLIAKFGLNMNSIPQDKRAEFLQALEELK